MIIKIKNLEAYTLLGVYPEERGGLRKVLLNLTVVYDASRAMHSDDVADALDYAELETRIVTSLAAQTFALIEALAHHVAQLVMAYPAVHEVTVEIDKPGALQHAPSVSITHTVSRE